MTMNPFVRKPTLPIRPAFDASSEFGMSVNLPGSGNVDPGQNPGTAGGMSPQAISSIVGGVTGVLNTTANTILGAIQSNNQVAIAEINRDAAQALAQIQGQLGVGGQTEAQRQALQQQQDNLMRLMSLLQPRSQAQPDNTMLYLALAAAGGYLIYTQMQKTPAPAPRRNPHRRSRR